VRIPVCAFEWRRSRRKTLNRNNDLTRHVRPAAADEETYGLFRKYILARHGHGGMADMDEADLADMLEGTRVACELTSYRDRQGHLRAAMLNDPLPDGLSLIYSFYDPDPEHRSLGRFMILDAVRRATEMGLPFVYLGYWVRGSKAMDYKSRFGPLEALIDGRWVWLPRAS
jgi:arginine-tRNA-protein transferase